MSEQDEEHSLIAQRREKLAAARAEGSVHSNDFRRNALACDLQERYADQDDESLETDGVHVAVAGRMMAKRVMGKASFAQVQDSSGRIQIFLQRDLLGDEEYKQFKGYDLGDILGAEGRLFRTRTGELSIRVERLRLLVKCLRPLPEKFHGLTDQEARYRQRYLDLIMNPHSQAIFRTRARVVQLLRESLDENGFLEVETPMMQSIPGGATARPFITHHNALDMALYLRVAPELYLKRLVVGGFEKVYEINRNFRNEGLSTRHNPEFTMLEFYQAYADHHDLMDFTEALLRKLALMLFGKPNFSYQGNELDFAQPFRRMTIEQAILEFNPDLSSEQLNDRDALRTIAGSLGIKIGNGDGVGKVKLEIFEKTAEEKLIQPTFITEFPTEVSPLARRNDKNPEVVDRFELFIAGREIANGFSELNDAEDQAERFRAQVSMKDSGDDEAMHFDADYIRALEYGLPPTAGEGIGVDRLVMLLTDSASIREVLLFPQLRRET